MMVEKRVENSSFARETFFPIPLGDREIFQLWLKWPTENFYFALPLPLSRELLAEDNAEIWEDNFDSGKY